MYVKEVKRIGKVGKDLLKDKDYKGIIETIIEKPLQKACIQFKEKNIETCMSSANKSNIVKEEKIVNKKDILLKNSKNKYPNFFEIGKGYAWVMLNYNTLSDENRKILFEMEENLQDESICFVKCSYVEFLNKLRKIVKKKLLVETFDDTYAEKFKNKQLIMMYNLNYPRRSVFIRYPINENTTVDDVENYFENFISNLKKQ